VCQVALRKYNDLKAEARGNGEKPPEACATLFADMFSSYSDYLQDLSDAILGSITEALSKKMQDSSADYVQ